MGARRKVSHLLAGGLLGGLAVVGLLLALAGSNTRKPAQPEYNGHTLTFWMHQTVAGGPNVFLQTLLSEQSQAAVRQMGTNCLPQFLTWINFPQNTPAGKFFLWSRSKTFHPNYPKSYRPQLAIHGFKALGREAEPAIPVLVAIVRNPACAQDYASDNAFYALMALSAIGPAGAAGIEEALQGIVDEPARANMLHNFDHPIWPERQHDVAAIVAGRLKNDPGQGPRMAAAKALRAFTHAADVAVPALASALNDRDSMVRAIAAESLGCLGRDAVAAIPALEAILKDSEPIVRGNAAQALRIIRAAKE